MIKKSTFPFSFLLLLPIFLCAQTITRAPYIQNATPNAVTLKWRTDQPSDSRVRYGASPGLLINNTDSTQQVTEHTVRISGLQPYTRYYYSVGTTGAALAGDDSLHYFTTNPTPGSTQPVKVWVIGDFGKGNNEEEWVRDSYLQYRQQNRPADVWLWMGDNAYDSGTDGEYQAKVFDIYGEVFANQCFWPTPGNHDYLSVNQTGAPETHTGPYYSIVEVPYNGEAGGLPSGGEMMYSFDYGNVHFVSLNSELGTWISSSNTPLTQWLEADLQATTQPWKVVYFHQPPHTKGSHDSDNFWEVFMLAMRNNIMPVVERNGVDLVLCGHSHVYERSYLMNGFYGFTFQFNPSYVVDGRSGTDSIGEAYTKYPFGVEPDKGTVYAVVGNSGSKGASAGLNHPIMYYSWGCDSCVGSLILDVEGDRLDGHYIKHDGTVLDDFTIVKDNTVAVQPSTESQMNALQVRPNPFELKLEVQIELKKEAKCSLSLIDMSGKEVYAERLGRLGAGSHLHILEDPAAKLPNGTYFLRLLADDKVLGQKVIKYRP